MSEWRDVTWGDLATLRYGRGLKGYQDAVGPVEVFGTNGPIGWHGVELFPEGVVVGRKGAYRGIHYARGPCWVIDTAFYLDIEDRGAVDPRWAYYQLRTIDLNSMDSGSAIPSTSREAFATIPVRLPPKPVQQSVVAVLDAIEGLIENNARRVELLERMAQAIYREWFVHFRFPGHEDATFVDSPLGPIPGSWEVRPVADIAASGRHAVTSGPFGSKLGRKDYVVSGVPVIRGANLRVGGGFDESDMVYVSEAKADELRSSLARRGDVVVTQRGTLGQVGLIPEASRSKRYVLSQSQMKVTPDPARMTPGFLYAYLRSRAATERFISQAMTSGVPHVNLALLREFEVLAPPPLVQAAFEQARSPLDGEAHALTESSRLLGAVRDLLLPKLVTGQIDVSELDLDRLVESVA